MLYIYNNYNLSEIVYKDNVKQATKSLITIVKALCERELFSYESRIKLTKKHLSIKSKIPIYINEQILLMPSHSPKNYNNRWINYYEVFSFEKYFNKTLVLFNNLKEMELNISYNVFNNMMKKASIIDEYFRNRLENSTI